MGTPTTISSGSITDSLPSPPSSSSSTSPDVRPTSSSSSNLRSTKTLSMPSPCSEPSSTEPRPPDKPQSSPRPKVNSPTSLLSTSTSSRPTPSTSSSRPLRLSSLTPTPTKLTSSTSMTLPLDVKSPVTSTLTEMSSTPKLSSPPSTPPTSLVPSTTKSTLCSTDSKDILKMVPNFSKRTRSRPLLIPLNSKSSPRLKLPDSTSMLRRETLTLRSLLLTSKSPSSLKPMLGSSPDNLTKMLLMPRTTSPPKLLSSPKKPTEEMVNSLILNGSLTSSKSKLLPSVTLSETELMTTSMMRDSTPCSTERLMTTLKPVLMVPSTSDLLIMI